MEKETLYKFFDGKASREEKEAVRIWLESSPENEQMLFREREFFDAMILSGSTKSAGTEKKSRPFYRTVLFEAMKIAAVFAITIACGTYFYKSEIRKIGEAMNTITVPAGQRANLTLADGTNVWLNARSEMRYPAVFTGNKREITLDGEAYFEVAADPDRLFVVEGGGVVVKVHGTVFNMKAREKQDHVDVSLLSGLVVVENHGVSRSLNPGETAVCKKSVPSIEKKTTDVSISCLWAKESLRFEKKTIYELTGYLSEWYGMDIRLDPSLPTDQAYTFTITHESLEEVLCLIAKITPIEYVFDEDNTVRITRK